MLINGFKPAWIAGFLCLYATGLAAQNAPALLDHRDRIRITRLDVVNSSYRETNISITPDGRYLYFMSLRGEQPWSTPTLTWRGKQQWDGDIWYSKQTNGVWGKPVCLPYGINTASGEDEPNVSPNGKRVYYQSWNLSWEQTGGPYYMADYLDGKWTSPKGLGGGITAFFKSGIKATDGMAIAPDGKRFVVAAAYDYDANMDLYMSVKGTNGWSYCKKLNISTPGDERSCFLAADGRTLYFASDGYKGFGGLDIFKTVLRDDGSFGEVINLGAPFNTAGDDYGFILTSNGNDGYFVRDGDIYYADLRAADPRIKPAVEIVLNGSITDAKSSGAVVADILLMDALTQQIVAKVKTDDKGVYRCKLPNRNATYDQLVVASGYDQASRVLKVAQSEAVQTLSSSFKLNPLAPPIAAVKPQPEKQAPAAAPAPSPQKPDVVSVTPPAQPKPVSPERSPAQTVTLPKKENPYSFDGIAENNLVLLLDVSASMNQSDKLPLVKVALKELIGRLRNVDRISIITFSGSTSVVAEGVSAGNQQLLFSAIDKISGGGATKTKSGLKKAYNIASSYFIPSGNNRIILATDGIFNISDLYSISNRPSGVALSVFSFGKLDNATLKRFDELASAGGGGHVNITPENIHEALLNEAKAVRKK